MQMLQIKEEDTKVKVKRDRKVKVKKDKIVKSFGELIREYQKAGYSNRESIEKAYSSLYSTDSIKKTTKKKNKEEKGEQHAIN